MPTSTVTWSLISGTSAQTAQVWGVANIVRRRKSQDVDTVTFTAPGRAVDAAPLFAPKSTVTIQRNGVVWFVGIVTKYPGDGSARGENQSYELSGPWWYLDNLVCRQTWKTLAGTATALSTRMILGQDISGHRITTGAVITEALNYAISAGAPFAIGTIDPNILPPINEVKDITCAEAVRSMLKWHPDCTEYFDYSATPPTLHIRQRANLTPVSLAVGQAPLSAIKGITSRQDLQVPSVVIHYEITGNVSGQPTFNILVDAAPAGATGQEFGGVCCTIPLRGETLTTVTQRIVTRAIRDDAVADDPADLLAYLTAHFGDLQTQAANPDITSAGITITACSRGLADPHAIELDPAGGTMPDPDHPGQTLPATRTVVYDASLENELVAGSIADWMFKQYAIRSQVHRISFTYTLDSGTGGMSGDITTKQGTIDITATNAGDSSEDTAQTKEYTTVTSFQPGDAIVVGLAAAYLGALNVLQYSGELELIEPEASGVAGLGNSLNLSGGLAGWASMAAPVIEESVDVDTGTTSLTFGPPEHLTPQDLVALVNVTRPSVGGGRPGDGPGGLGTANSGTRSSGLPGGATSPIGLGVDHPTNNACPSGGGGGGLGPVWFTGASGGQIAFFLINGNAGVSTLPDGVTTVANDFTS